MLRRHLNFRQISRRFTSSFANPSFQDLNGSHVMFWNMIIFKFVEFQGWTHSKYWYFCIERWDLLSLRSSTNDVLFHIEWLCQKTAGNVHRPPYRYTAVTHWACPASSEEMLLIGNATNGWTKSWLFCTRTTSEKSAKLFSKNSVMQYARETLRNPVCAPYACCNARVSYSISLL